MLSELKKLLRHSSVYSIGNLLSKAIGFFLIPLYTRYLTPADYGVLELLELTSSIISLFLGLRIGSAVIRFFYDYEDAKEKQEVISTALLGVLFVGILIFFLSRLISGKLSYLVFNTTIYEKHFKIILVCTALSLVASVPEAYLMARQQSFFYTSVTLGTLTFYLTFNIWFIVFFKWGILGILYSSLITKIFNSSFLCIYAFINNNIKFSFKKFTQMLKYGIPLIPAACGMFILNYFDRFLLQKITTSSEVGIYALGYKFGFMLSFLVIVPIQMILHPQGFEMSQKPEGKTTLEKMFTYIFIIIVLPALCLALLTKDAIKIMATPPFYSAFKVAPYVVLGYVFMGLSNFFQLGMLIEKSTHLIGFAVLFAAITNPIFNLVLIPKFGIMGAAYATAFSFFIMFIIIFYLCQKRYFLEIEYKRVLKIVLASLSIYFISNFISPYSIIHSIILKTCLILSFPFLLYFSRFFTKEEKDKITSAISKVKLKPLFINK